MAATPSFCRYGDPLLSARYGWSRKLPPSGRAMTVRTSHRAVPVDRGWPARPSSSAGRGPGPARGYPSGAPGQAGDPAVTSAGLRRDDEVAVHTGDPGRGGGCGAGRPGLREGMHVPVQPRGVVGHVDPDVPGVDLRLALESLLDDGLDALRAGGRADGDGVRDPDDPTDLADHPLDLPALEFVVHLAIQRHPAVLDPGVYPPLGDLHVVLQNVRDRRGDVGVVARRAGQFDLQIIGHGLDPVNPLRRPCGGELFGEAGNGPGQRHRPIRDRDADGVGIGYLRIPLQLVDDVVPDLRVGFHALTPFHDYRVASQAAPGATGGTSRVRVAPARSASGGQAEQVGGNLS